MRFMVIMKGSDVTESGQQPSAKLLEEMTAFNEELVKAGVMLAGEGLLPSSQGAKVEFSGDADPRVIDGPFAESKELVAGFWILQCRDLQECVEWVSERERSGTSRRCTRRCRPASPPGARWRRRASGRRGSVRWTR